MYFTDRGIEELADRRGQEQVSLAWLALQLRGFVDEHPEFETAIERLATRLARLDDTDAELGFGELDDDLAQPTTDRNPAEPNPAGPAQTDPSTDRPQHRPTPASKE